eukprot:136159-Prymnesium_polylepis.1
MDILHTPRDLERVPNFRLRVPRAVVTADRRIATHKPPQLTIAFAKVMAKFPPCPETPVLVNPDAGGRTRVDSRDYKVETCHSTSGGALQAAGST